MSACYFLSSVCLVSKANLGERWQTTAAFSCATARVGSQKISWSLQPTMETRGWGLCAAKFPQSRLWLMLLHLVAISFHKGEDTESSHTSKEPSLLRPSPAQRCRSGWSRQWLLHTPRAHTAVTAAPLVWEANWACSSCFIVTHHRVSGETGVILEEL